VDVDHPPIFIVLSMVIACVGSWTALDLFRRVHAHTGTWRGAWLAAAAVAMGLSIWAMHFVAMLGFNPGVEVRYDIQLTVLSLLLAIAVTAFAFFSAAEQHSKVYLLIGGLVMGAGICIMHYVGMAALVTPATLHNDKAYIVAAFLVAVLASTSALLVAIRERTFVQRLLAALVLGFAIVGMHFTAMAGVHVLPGAATTAHSGIDSIALATAVASGTLFILFLALIAALSDRRFEAMAAREALRSEQQLRTIIEHLPLGVFVAEAPSGQIRFANAEAARLLAHPVGGTAIWAHEQEYGAIDAEGRRLPPEQHVLYQAMQESRRVGPRLQPYRRGDGEIIQLEVTAAPVLERTGDGALAVVAFQDVTEKIAADARVAAAMAEKAEAQAALLHAQRLESLGRLTGGVAHDFNNLLTVVIGALDIILKHPEDAARRTKLGEAALTAAKRGERLTAQLLAFARRQPLQPVDCDLNDLIRESEPLIRGVTNEALTLNLRLCNDKAIALIDPTQFEALLLNLIVNAADATPRGGKITVETRVSELAPDAIPGLAAGAYFSLRVTDTGQGMSGEVMNRIFEPFFTTKSPGKGTGLGLSQVYGFVRQSGGEVRVQSTIGQGTTFTVYLPVADREAEVPAAQPSAQRDHNPSLRVLLTEDDPSVAGITETMLKNLGHDVVRAQNAEQALQVLKSERPVDLLLSDVIMPGGVNGVELARAAVTLRPGIKVLLSSGFAGESVDRAIDEGAWPFLRKPYLQDELAEHLLQFYDPSPDKVA
jgi:NO-binding membrane sensor protein with MHYT domain/nitrogen-specific signal transduction histidine kinase/ActR/RegA family two-component response regulator